MGTLETNSIDPGVPIPLNITMTPKLKKLLIVAAITAVLAAVLILGLLPRVFPSVACVYQEPVSGDVVKGWGQECDRVNGVVLARE